MDREVEDDLPSYCPDWIVNEPLVKKAFDFADRLHKGQLRASGEPYIIHPIAVAGLLRDLGGSSALIAAGLLHDILEDTDTTPEQLEAEFGVEVTRLVQGVTKLSKFNFGSKTERQAENFRRMFMAMAQDFRVIVVKLADRLHNMRTLQHLPPQKQQAIARETMDIFAPLANRLGIGQFKWELEDLAFKYLEPEQYRRIQSLVADTRARREEQINQVVAALKERLDRLGLTHASVYGRPKHLYGIYSKMLRQGKDYEEIYDVLAVRIITATIDECYRALAVVHDAYKPIPGRFKDYIALPKANRYQSLHTTIVLPTGQPLEVQIRTQEMHQVAEYGVAAHWKYKESNNGMMPDERFVWLRQLVEWQKEYKDDQEYLESVKEDLFDSEVYVFSPKGDVYQLPRGATPVDFAYRVHTELGNHCCGAIVNQRMVPLNTELQNGDIVMILRNNNAHPSLDWINFVATNSAKHRIRQWFKRYHREENIARGTSLLEKELGKNGLEVLLRSDQMLKIAERCNYHSVDDLLAALGYGEISVLSVVNKLREQPAQQSLKLPSAPAAPSKTAIVGLEGLLHHIASCCKPLPGEPIIGVVTQGSNRGISIHHQDCSNLKQVPPDRLVPIRWSECQNKPTIYPVDIEVTAIDRVGVMKDILARVADNKVNVRNASVDTAPGQAAVIKLTIDITDRAQFEKVCSQIQKMSDVLSVRRVIKDNGTRI
ncbi:MAG: bifunctional (p)ppGpp synthetase/guanosine-3',5'-bis(diphosphate) 3'-pyrophosphohydrolase [Pseudanabaenaceae cyanobacterium SKYGB_i_bin29]|nr:bifunctional (p)ppGpp synthetase/guanosine-3',5'-bis(diphosphate) 3'-pyrophosphohydrolase [Pseudanabaenaceae cyanobacterium SKYG29]MDW8421717.1 bifunctional (p)ppGpp synthetase/guanosine-3',5'-bis(diphosphate) 3'-pyrophosphohydrolase [Pseudanabaenaceae cyanobacterium SKYGB_i_bin29]